MKNALVQSLGATVATVTVSVASARLYIALWPPPWVTRGYTALGIWSLPLAAFIVVVSVLLRRLLAGSGRWTRAVVAVLAGMVAGAAYTYGAFFATDGYVPAFDSPILYFWVAGSVAGFAVALLLRSTASPEFAT